MNKYDNCSKEDLINLLLELEKKRAFSYEDQLKLTILDKSPFTIWASDRDCIIRMWEGQCESMYGRKKEDVIGKDFVDLFVARDEQAAARRDQLEIIDNGKEFHNIANDQGRNGNTLQLITNCFRIKDPISGEYWNAEMGVAIDYYEEEKKQLARNIEEGKLIQTLISDFGETQRQYREQFIDRKESLLASIRTNERDAARRKRLNEYREKTKSVKIKVQEIEEDLDNIIIQYYKMMRNCTTSFGCSEIKTKFNLVLRKILNEFDDVVLELEIINYDIINQSSLVSLKDEVMKLTTTRNTRLETYAHEIWLKAEDAITEYGSLGTIVSESVRLKKLKEQRDEIVDLKNEIHTVGDEIYSQLANATTEDLILSIKASMEERYNELELKLHEIRKRLDS